MRSREELCLTCLLSGLLLFCDKFELSFWDLFGFETQVKFSILVSVV